MFAMLIPLFAVNVSVLTESEYEAMKKEREELLSQNKNLTSSLEGMNKELSDKYSELQANTDAFNNTALKEQSYSELLASCVERYNAEKELLNVTTEMMTSINGEISKLEERRSQLEESIVETVRNLHEMGDAGFLEYILASNGILDLLNRFEYVTSIMDQYELLVGEVEENTRILEDRYAEFETLKNTQEETLFLLESRKATYDEMIAKCVAELEALDSSSGALKDFITIKETEIAAIETQISSAVGRIENLDALIKEYEDEQSFDKFYWPCKATKLITCEYGWRDLWGKDNFHNAIDIGAKYNTVYASRAGVVVTAEYSSSYGYYMVIAHKNGIETLYAHLSKMYYAEGTVVKAGQAIGVSGNSGWSTGAHLHFEIRVNGNPVNPLNYKKLGLTGVKSYVDVP